MKAAKIADSLRNDGPGTNSPACQPKVKQHKPRQARKLSPQDRRIKEWIQANNGVLSSVAREFSLSTAFVQRIAYDREARSADMRVERRLKYLGCPLKQKVR